MNTILFKCASSLLSLAAIALVCSGLPVQANPVNTPADLDVSQRSTDTAQPNQAAVAQPVLNDSVASSTPEAEVQATNSQSLDLRALSLATETSAAESVSASIDTAEAQPSELAAPTSESATRTAPVPGTPATSAAALTDESVSPQAQAASTSPTLDKGSEVAQLNIEPGRATRSGSSYIGIAGNLGLSGGSTDLSRGNFAVISKIGLTNTFSVRPSAVIGDNTTILIPVTYDFPVVRTQEIGEARIGIAPYVGGGVAISTGDNSEVSGLISGGVDLPITRQFTANAAVNVGFFNETDIGLLLGVGYTFSGF